MSDHQGRTHVLAGEAHDQHDGPSDSDVVSDDHEWTSPLHLMVRHVMVC